MIQPSFVFTDRAVLQRGRKIAVFGTCDSARLTVSFAGYSADAEIKNGAFIAYLPPLDGNLEGELIFTTESEI